MHDFIFFQNYFFGFEKSPKIHFKKPANAICASAPLGNPQILHHSHWKEQQSACNLIVFTWLPYTLHVPACSSEGWRGDARRSGSSKNVMNTFLISAILALSETLEA